MSIAFATGKNIVNHEKHGISLKAAEEFEWNEAVTWPDVRKDYGEMRMVGVGYIGNRLYVIIFVDQDDARRIISLRNANKREEGIYAET